MRLTKRELRSRVKSAQVLVKSWEDVQMYPDEDWYKQALVIVMLADQLARGASNTPTITP